MIFNFDFFSSFTDYENVDRITSHDFFQLYESVSLIHRQQLASDDSWLREVEGISHSCLKPKLRHYQKESVAWMLRQERKNVVANHKKGECMMVM